MTATACRIHRPYHLRQLLYGQRCGILTMLPSLSNNSATQKGTVCLVCSLLLLQMTRNLSRCRFLHSVLCFHETGSGVHSIPQTELSRYSMTTPGSSPKTPPPVKLDRVSGGVYPRSPNVSVNKNVEWINSRGAWTFYIALILLNWLVLSTVMNPGACQGGRFSAHQRCHDRCVIGIDRVRCWSDKVRQMLA